MLSHTTPSAPNTLSPGPESEAGPYPSRRNAADLRFIPRFVWPANGKQMDAAEGTDKEEEVEGGRRKKESKRGKDGPF